MDSRVIALAGIIATAVVGIAGAASSWLIARDDRANQRSLAHDARVYDRRADAYLTAMRIVAVQRREIDRELNRMRVYRNPKLIVPKLFSMVGDADADVYEGLEAFGTADAVNDYRDLRRVARHPYITELGTIGRIHLMRNRFRGVGPPPAGYLEAVRREREQAFDRIRSALRIAAKVFPSAQRQFQRDIHRDLTL